MTDILMPKLGLTMTEGLLSEWRVSPGDKFSSGDVLFVVETEKVANDVEADSDGVIGEILAPEGETVPVGAVVARLQRDYGSAASPPAAATEKPAHSEVAKSSPQAQARAAPVRVRATPLARRIAKSEGVDLKSLKGTGPRGCIKAADVSRAASAAGKGQPASTAASAAPVSEARAATARRVSAAKRDIPHFYVTRHAEVSALLNIREDLNSRQSGVRISITHFLIKALALALAEMPHLNKIWADERIQAFETIDIGVVTETENGLRIPVIRDAQRRSLDEIALEMNALGERTRRGALKPSDVGGGAISISNVGMFGADSLTPIINPPQSMIVGIGAEQQIFRPDNRGAPALQREIILTLACDHRVIDGADGARFVSLFADTLERPALLLRASTHSTPTTGDE